MKVVDIHVCTYRVQEVTKEERVDKRGKSMIGYTGLCHRPLRPVLRSLLLPSYLPPLPSPPSISSSPLPSPPPLFSSRRLPSMLGWFSSFREKGAPTSYGEQSTPSLDPCVVGLLCLFILPSLAFLLILPGIRHTKTVSSLVFFSSMAIGAVLAVGLHYPTWHVAQARIQCRYKAFSRETLSAEIDVLVGLQSLNITLSKLDSNNETFTLIYNERFDISEMHLMQRELSRALLKGLPYPILKVVEYLSVDREGFNWGRMYRVAGYYTTALLWLGVCCWVYSLFLLILSPSHFFIGSLSTSLLLLSASFNYVLSVPQSLNLRFPTTTSHVQLLFQFGHSFYATLIAGVWCLVFSLLLLLLDLLFSYQLETCFTAHRSAISMETRDGPLLSPSSISLPPIFTTSHKIPHTTFR